MDPSAASDVVVALCRPIEGPEPTGRDTRYESAHAAIRAEVDKLDPVAGGGGLPNWGMVCDASLALLREQSKDLSLASYLCVGMAVTRGVAGMTPVLAGMAALIREAWTTLHPRGRERRRVAAIEWALGRVHAHFEGAGPGGASASEIAAALGALSEVEAALEAVCGVRVGSASDIRALIARWALPATPVAPVSATVEKAADDDGVDSTQAPADDSASPDGSLSARAEVPASREARPAEVSVSSVMASLRTLARRLRAEDPTRAQAYRLLRLGIWLDVAAPLVTRNGRTSALPVDSRTRAAIDRAEASSRWQEVVEMAEEAALRSPLALDLQRLVHRALVALGPPFAEASRAVGEETLRLVTRERGLLSALARDGSALADDATKGWISSLMPASTPTVATSANTADEPELAEAGAIIERLEQRLAACSSGRGRGELRLWAGLRLAELGSHVAAARVLAPLVAEIERLGLVAWDPEFCAGVAEALVRSARQVAVPEVAGAVETAFSFLWTVRPCAGARLQPE